MSNESRAYSSEETKQFIEEVRGDQSLWVTLQIRVDRGSNYIWQTTVRDYNRLMSAVARARLDITTLAEECTAQRLLSKIEANESLRYCEYMIINTQDLFSLVNEIFNVEV